MVSNILEKIKEYDINSVLIISDFDFTLTKAIDDKNQIYPTSISVFRRDDFLGKDYIKKTKELAKYYRPIENDTTISEEKKYKLMEEWWHKNIGDLIIKSGLNKDLIQKVTDKNLIESRAGLTNLLIFLSNKNIPLFILSSGIGEVISGFFEKIEIDTSNIHILANFYNYDENGFATELKGDMIHTLNKDLHNIKNLPFYESISKKKNIILLGDSLSDVKMSKGFDYDNILKIGFLNVLPTDTKYEQAKKDFEEKYDILLDWDSGMQPIIDILEEIAN